MTFAEQLLNNGITCDNFATINEKLRKTLSPFLIKKTKVRLFHPMVKPFWIKKDLENLFTSSTPESFIKEHLKKNPILRLFTEMGKQREKLSARKKVLYILSSGKELGTKDIKKLYKEIWQEKYKSISSRIADIKRSPLGVFIKEGKKKNTKKKNHKYITVQNNILSVLGWDELNKISTECDFKSIKPIFKKYPELMKSLAEEKQVKLKQATKASNRASGQQAEKKATRRTSNAQGAKKSEETNSENNKPDEFSSLNTLFQKIIALLDDPKSIAILSAIIQKPESQKIINTGIAELFKIMSKKSVPEFLLGLVSEKKSKKGIRIEITEI